MRRTLFVLLVIVIAVMAMPGCTLFSSEPTLKDVAAGDGLYHFRVPEDWQTLSEATAVTVYAGDELPESPEQVDVLSVFVLAANATTDAPVPDELSRIIGNRSEQRGWTSASIGAPEDATIGGRPASVLTVSAIDSLDRPFIGRFYLVRTGGREVLIGAIAPEDAFDDYVDEIDAITENWFWHVADGAQPSGEPASDD